MIDQVPETGEGSTNAAIAKAMSIRRMANLSEGHEHGWRS